MPALLRESSTDKAAGSAIAPLVLWPQIEADALVDETKRVRLAEVNVAAYHAGPHHLVEEACYPRVGHGADAVAQGIAGIDNAIFLHLADRVGEPVSYTHLR